ncbi:endonuclease [Knoellia sinensis KCTC 19936]|uniref:Endonuclease n=1 Tax=Knoellia sinensis KCTC 19936 TaxID=1385520 RepID=A0A0A0J8Q3_9MICO|nr:endonuclease/exonuclease/phosphatase family protein [Knoellia sinensis]KGN33139.1 endonuclease [Knoellia sinensis KCTC 19936]
MTDGRKPLGPAPDGRRRVLAGLCVLITVGVAMAVATRWLDTSAARLPVLQAAFPMIGGVAIAWAGLSLVLLRRRLALALPAVCVALVPTVLGASTLGSDTVPGSEADEVVAASNLEFGEADPTTLVARVRDLKVDTLVLTEITPDAAAALDESGLKVLLPHRVGQAQVGADGTVILSRHRLTDIASGHIPGLFDQPVATVHARTGDYTLRAMHPYPPTPRLVRGWHRQLGEAANWVAAQPDARPLVLAGDFNASQAHPAFRTLTKDMVHAHRVAGSGWVRTWPQNTGVPAFVQLDHVLVRRGGVVGAGATTLPGTDHSLVWARLNLS